MDKRIAVIGTFDGLHLGHRFLLSMLRTEGMKRGLRPLVVTFDRHPLSVIAPDRVPPQLLELHRKRSMIEADGMELLVLPFNERLRSLTAREFLQFLAEDYGVKALLMGYNHNFGSDRLTTINQYRAVAQDLGIEVIQAPEYRPEGELPVSSSAVRALLSEGKADVAAELLGRPYSLSGTVTHGQALGRTIGFPTANIVPLEPTMAIPATGVYAAEVTIEGETTPRRALVNVGYRPTVDSDSNPRLSIEAHIPNYQGNLYGLTLRVEFLRRLRAERRFPSLDALQSQIRHDLSQL
ncbi:MAG: riboflavin biosynthesis protein RibF [Bacteroidales bacterium]|nr:riboflavin biosynthesis protein RibF [Bacteroidales bacterium]